MTNEGELKTLAEFPLWLRLQRQKAGLSARRLAELAGFESHNIISLLEKPSYLRKNQPSTDTCNKLAKALNADPDLVLFLAKHRDIDPRKTIKVRPEIAQLQRRVMQLGEIEDESELQKNIKLLNSFLDSLFR